MTESWEDRRQALGAYIRQQRKLANLSLRQFAELTSLSNPYLSQIERGLHEPSVRVLKAISGALNISAETLLAQAGLLDTITGEAGASANAGDGADSPDGARVEDAIRADRRLSGDQKAALLAVYRTMLSTRLPATASAPVPSPGEPTAPAAKANGSDD